MERGMYADITIDRCGNAYRFFQGCNNYRVPSGVYVGYLAAFIGIWDIQGSEFIEYKKIVPDAVRKGD